MEGVQPSIAQNPTSSDPRHQDLLPKGPGANTNLAALNGHDNITVKPLVKHILSQEATQLFQRICSALLDETNEEWRQAAFQSLRSSPALHQLIPYFVEFFAEQVTHHMKDIFILTQMMHATAALLTNQSLYLAPYIVYMVPPVLTCLVAKRLGPTGNSAADANGSLQSRALSHYPLREHAASILTKIAQTYSHTSQILKPRIARTCLKHFLDPNKPLGTHYGALCGLRGVAGSDGVRLLILPNLKIYDSLLKEAAGEESKKADVDMVVGIILKCIEDVGQSSNPLMANGVTLNDALKDRLTDRVGEIIAERIVQTGRSDLAKVVLESNVDL